MRLSQVVSLTPVLWPAILFVGGVKTLVPSEEEEMDIKENEYC